MINRVTDSTNPTSPGRRRLKRAAAWGATLVVGGYASFVGLYGCAASSPADQVITLNDGSALAWRQVREPATSESRVILIHGAPADCGSWNRFEAEAADELGSCEIIAVDRFGYGNSTPEADLTLAQQARSLAPMLTDRTIVVGHSYGGPVALRAAIEFPDRIAGVVLVAGACDANMQDAQWARKLLEIAPWIVPRPWAQANRELLALTDENDAMTPLLDQVTCPVAIVHGTWDPVCPHDGTIEYLQSTLVNADVIVDSLPRAGHNLHLSHPERIASAITDVLGESGHP